ncbi:transposase [Streptomyces sp. Mg1]|nr:transposase [Streptomyces sp. Mg1]
MPERYGPWDRSYDLFRRWQRNGSWKRILEQLQVQADAQGLIIWDVSVDSTIARTHQHAAGARKMGTCSVSHPAVATPSPPTTGSNAPAAG